MLQEYCDAFLKPDQIPHDVLFSPDVQAPIIGSNDPLVAGILDLRRLWLRVAAITF